MKTPHLLLLATAVAVVITQPARLMADPFPDTIWQYTLLPESMLTDDCDICDRPTIVAPLRGTFQMRSLGCGPLFCNYAWEKVSLTAESGSGMTYKLEGEGSFSIGGEVAVFQNLTLSVFTDPDHTGVVRYFTNTTAIIERMWPMVKISLDETNPTFLQHLRLVIVAAPMRELWFSTRSGFTASIWQAPTNHVNPGDLVSSAAHVVKRNQQLTAQLGIMGPVPDLGLKDVDVLPGGEIVFGIETNVFSESLGQELHTGDLLSDRGRVVATNSQLIAAFAPDPSTGDVGLAAVQVLDSGEIYFSVQTNFFSQNLGQDIGPGDLLSNGGIVVRRNADLVARFFPQDPTSDYGLATVYVWPSGEIWFATKSGFISTNLTSYAAGDLLSDQGYVVYRNLDLLAPFAPIEDLSNFGLDALFLVTDVTTPPPADRFKSIVPNLATGDLTFRFTGLGRVWQLERTSQFPSTWSPVSPITTELPLTDYGVLNRLPQAFYRLHEW